MKRFEYDAILHEMPDNGGAYVIFPWDIRREFGKGRLKVHAVFDGIPYDGSIVNMGLKNEDGTVCYIIGVLKSIRKKLNKSDGDILHAVIEPMLSRETEIAEGELYRQILNDHLPVNEGQSGDPAACKISTTEAMHEGMKSVLMEVLPAEN